MTNSITAFESGKTYKVKFIGDSELIVPLFVIKRTAKSVRIKSSEGEKTCRIKEYGGTEYVLPFGNYSMAPSCRAENPIG